MMYLSSKENTRLQPFQIGGKAKHLYRLLELGINVPHFIVIPQEALHQRVPEDIRASDASTITKFIQSLFISEDEITELLSAFPDTQFFAVRSSAIDDDGTSFCR